MEKIIELYIRSESLTEKPFHTKQIAYQEGKSPINALRCQVEGLEKTLAGEKTMEATTEKGCTKGVVSPLLWSLIVNDILRKLNESGTTQEYAGL